MSKLSDEVVLEIMHLVHYFKGQELEDKLKKIDCFILEDDEIGPTIVLQDGYVSQFSLQLALRDFVINANKQREASGLAPYPYDSWPDYHDDNCHGGSHYCFCSRSSAYSTVKIKT